MSERIEQSRTFSASVDDVYALLTESTRFSEMSGGAPTDIDASDGGSFSCFGGMIVGRNIECAPGKRLVQAWRAKTWDEGTYSIVRFEIEAERDGAKVTLEHSAFPEGQGEHLAAGWVANYWEPMEKALS